MRGFQILGGFSSFGFIIAQSSSANDVHAVDLISNLLSLSVILMMRAWAIWERGIVITAILAIMIVVRRVRVLDSLLLLLSLVKQACVGVDVMVLKRYLSGITCKYNRFRCGSFS